ncbi:hypothetical protein ACUXG4_002656 [Cupriavidus metallidurans]
MAFMVARILSARADMQSFVMPREMRRNTAYRPGVVCLRSCRINAGKGDVPIRNDGPNTLTTYVEESIMKRNSVLLAGLIAATLSGIASAQTGAVTYDTQRDVNQQQRIENGLKSGTLTTREASSLEKQESKVDRMEANSLQNGRLSPQEQARIQNAQNRVSQDISRDTHNGKVGNPDSVSSQRMQADVQRNINQETRVRNGVENGSLTNRETAQLERGQAHVDQAEARAGRNGHVGAGEQRSINRAENHASGQIYHDKHNGHRRG